MVRRQSRCHGTTRPAAPRPSSLHVLGGSFGSSACKYTPYTLDTATKHDQLRWTRLQPLSSISSTMAAHSPASSPRLPSPPPIPEDQVGPGPMSPGFSLFEDHGKPQTTMDTGASRRIRPGTKAEDMAEGPPLIDLQDVRTTGMSAQCYTDAGRWLM